MSAQDYERARNIWIYFPVILGALRKIVKSDCYILHVCLSSSSILEQLGSHWKDIHDFISEDFPETCRENLSSIKIWREKNALYMTTYVRFW